MDILRSKTAAFMNNSHSGGSVPKSNQTMPSERGWPPLVAQWKLNGNRKDSARSHHGIGHRIKFVRGRDGKPNGAALFNGKDAYIEVPNTEALPSGTRDFSHRSVGQLKPGH